MERTDQRWGDNIRVEEWEVQTIGCKAIKLYCTTWGV